MTDDDIEIDVRFEPEREAPTMDGDRPLLVRERHSEHGSGWVLWHIEYEGHIGLNAYFIPGDLGDLDRVVAEARQHLKTIREYPE